jgi:hypothetical protein
MFKNILRKKEKKQKKKKNNNQPLRKSNHWLQPVVVYQPGDRLKEGTQIFSLLSVQQKVFKK